MSKITFPPGCCAYCSMRGTLTRHGQRCTRRTAARHEGGTGTVDDDWREDGYGRSRMTGGALIYIVIVVVAAIWVGAVLL